MTGISNGGMMAYAMAAEASGHIAAISSVSGQVEIPVIHPTRAVPTMEFHSVNDPIAKFDGTPSANPLDRLSVMQGIDQWIKADGCDKEPTTGTAIVGAAGSISAGETATPITYTHCRSGTEVALWRFTGSGHVWPGSPLNMGPKKNWILAGVGRGIILVTRTRRCGSSSRSIRCRRIPSRATSRALFFYVAPPPSGPHSRFHRVDATEDGRDCLLRLGETGELESDPDVPSRVKAAS